jgi:hypothetical protein
MDWKAFFVYVPYLLFSHLKNVIILHKYDNFILILITAFMLINVSLWLNEHVLVMKTSEIQWVMELFYFIVNK